MFPSPSLGPPWLSESPSPAFGPCGIPDAAPPEELPDDLLAAVEDVFDVDVPALAGGFVLLWLGLAPQPAAAKAMSSAAMATGRRRPVGRFVVIAAPLRSFANTKDALWVASFPAAVFSALSESRAHVYCPRGRQERMLGRALDHPPRGTR